MCLSSVLSSLDACGVGSHVLVGYGRPPIIAMVMSSIFRVWRFWNWRDFHCHFCSSNYPSSSVDWYCYVCNKM